MSVLISVWLAASAQAQTWQFAGEVLAPDATIPFASESIGAPAVTYDSLHDQFIMIFEARTTLTDSRCPQGIWALGFATSPDGTTWTIDADPVLLPVPGSGTPYSCVAAHPAAVFGAIGNGLVQVYFKAEEDTDSCVTSSFSTCPYTGIGRLSISLDAAGEVNTVTVQASLVRELSAVGGFPSAARDGGNFYLAYQEYPNVRFAESAVFTSFPLGDVAFDVTSNFDPTGTGDSALGPLWVYDEFFSPSLNCDAGFLFPWNMWVGSRDTNFGAVVQGGWGKGLRGVLSTSPWTLSESPVDTWANDQAWRHWDVLRLSTGDYLVWYSQKDQSGNNSIYFGGTTLTFNNSDVESRDCP